MAETPKDKIDIEDFDSVEEYISAAMNEGWTITAEDFEGRPCAYCGELLEFVDWPENVVTWDIRIGVEEKTEYFQRSYFCSEDCKKDAQYDEEWLRDGSPYDEGDRLHESELEDMNR